MVYVISKLSAGYDGRMVLNNIDLTLNRGDFTAVIGPNGTGKSSLLKVLTGILPPTQGIVRFLNKELRLYRAKEVSRECSYITQSIENIQNFSVREFVLMGRFPHKKLFSTINSNDYELAATALKLTDTTKLADRPLTELSGGELQRARIAQALAQDSPVMLLDEPVSHLDIRHSLLIMDILRKLNQKGKTIIAVLHDINLAFRFCGRIVALSNGSILYDGEAEKAADLTLIRELYGLNCSININSRDNIPFVIPQNIHVEQ